MAVISILCSRLIHGGQLLNGLAGPTVMNAAPFLSTTWFSPDERATATAIASLLNYLGAAGAFLVGPLVVPSPNGTSHHLLVSQSNTEHIKDRIEAVLYAGVFKKKLIIKHLHTCMFGTCEALPSSGWSAKETVTLLMVNNEVVKCSAIRRVHFFPFV